MKRSGWPTMRSVALTVVVAASLIAMTVVGASAKTTLTVYTAIEADDLKKYAARFNEDYPDIEIRWIRDSTGIVTAKIKAEKDNPQGDVIWGLAATSLLVLKPLGMLEPYAPKGLEKLSAQFRDSGNPPSWVGMDAWVAAICFNTAEAAKKNLPKPTSWKDLTKPVYKGQIVMFDKMQWLHRREDGLRKFLLYEPRGAAVHSANLVLPSRNPKAALGYVIMGESQRVHRAAGSRAGAGPCGGR